MVVERIPEILISDYGVQATVYHTCPPGKELYTIGWFIGTQFHGHYQFPRGVSRPGNPEPRPTKCERCLKDLDWTEIDEYNIVREENRWQLKK